MKVCPKCNRNFDESMFFCLEDGTALQSPDDVNLEQTLVLPSPIESSDFEITDSNERSFTETIILPEQYPTEDHISQNQNLSMETAVRENEVRQHQTFTDKTPKKNRKGLFVILGLLFAGLILIISGLAGWKLSQSAENNDVALLSNLNSDNRNTSLISNETDNEVYGSSGSADSNISNHNTEMTEADKVSNSAVNKPTPKPSPAKTLTPTPTPSPLQTPSPRPTPTTQPPSPTPQGPPQTVDGGVLNSKALLLYQPVYPPSLKTKGIGGTVNVRVLVNESGKVTNARAADGHQLLKAAAERAARSCLFSPVNVNGKRVKVSGIIVYKFIP